MAPDPATTALVIVDVQNDFLPGGALAEMSNAGCTLTTSEEVCPA